jgi:hypothetical protein
MKKYILTMAALASTFWAAPAAAQSALDSPTEYLQLYEFESLRYFQGPQQSYLLMDRDLFNDLLNPRRLPGEDPDDWLRRMRRDQLITYLCGAAGIVAGGGAGVLILLGTGWTGPIGGAVASTGGALAGFTVQELCNDLARNGPSPVPPR